jgi:hypothetical protein
MLVAPCAADAEPVNSSAPTITGALEVGQVLTATTGTWTDPTSTIASYSYQWQRCLQYVCTDIDGATSSTYTLIQSDLDEQMDVVVTAHDASGALEDAASGQTFLVGSREEALWALAESLQGTGQGSLSSSVGGPPSSALSCPGSCGSSFPAGTTITISEQPAPGSRFAGWGGACSGTATTCTITMGADESVSASFSTLGAPVPPEGQGEATGGSTGATPSEAPTVEHGARLLGLHGVGHHVEATMSCEGTSPCRLTLTVSSASPHARVIAQHSFTLAAGRTTRITLALNPEGERLLARHHRLSATARLLLLLLGTPGAHRVTVGAGHLTLAA